MANIKTQGNGNAAVVILDDLDRYRLSSALTSFAAAKGLSMSAVAQEIGVGRTYLYSLLEANQIELSRLCKIQEVTNFRLISDADAYLYTSGLFNAITGRPIAENWVEQCPCVPLDAFYVMTFLLPAMTSEIRTINLVYGEHIKFNPETTLPFFYNEEFMVSRIVSYCTEAIRAFGEDFIEEQFDFGEPLILYFPVAINSSFWPDFFEVAKEYIYQHFTPKRNNNCDEGVIEESHEAESLEILNKKNERKDYWRTLKAHAKAKKWIMEAASKISEWEKTLTEYCTSMERIPRSRFFLPLELEKVVNDLESNTIGVSGD